MCLFGVNWHGSDDRHPLQEYGSRNRQSRDLQLALLVLEEDGWHVDYELKDPRLKGGGPHPY